MLLTSEVASIVFPLRCSVDYKKNQFVHQGRICEKLYFTVCLQKKSNGRLDLYFGLY
jgi:hypothetical protein